MTQLSPSLANVQLQNVRLDLTFNTKSKWALVSGQLMYNGHKLEVTLVIEDQQNQTQHFNLPVTLKGKLYEVVPLPLINKAWLEIKSMGKVEGVGSIQTKPVDALTSRYLMWKRLYNTYTGISASQRRILGLRLANMAFNPYPSYTLVGKSRYYTASPSYSEWIAQSEQFTPIIRRQLKRAVKQLALTKLSFVILIDVREVGTPETVLQSLSSLQQQFEISAQAWLLTTDSSQIEWQNKLGDRLPIVSDSQLAYQTQFINSNSKHWVFIMAAGTQLAPWALAWMATAAVTSDIAVMYSDHDYLINGERADPQFKPDWSLELARCSGFVGSAFALRGDLFSKVISESPLNTPYQLMLDATAVVGDAAIHHIPAVLCHYAAQTESITLRNVLEQHFKQHNIAAKVTSQGDHLRIRYSLPEVQPKVSIVVPTRDGLHYLQPCVTSLLQKSTWQNYELLIVDNQSSDPAALTYLRQIEQDARVKVLHYDKPFNFSAINNFAVAQASGDIICLLNNDTEIISPDWLEEMVSRLLQPNVGLVGTRLYYSDGRVQHAGDVLGPGGCATHIHGILEADDPGYMHRAVLAQDLSAVTAACFVTHKKLYLQLGGLDEVNLTVAFNDVDYCLRVREAGQRVIYTPYAELYHHESVSRGKDDSPVKRARAKRESNYMRKRWGHIIDRDPFYNPNLNYSQPDFKLGKIPRVGWPW